jgi:pyruvate dehydrogenase E2 component (dihydrolipoamide acetyltransferase)
MQLEKTMAIIGEENEDISDLLEEVKEGEAGSSETKESKDKKEETDEEPSDPVFGDLEKNGSKQKTPAAPDADGRIEASPLARKMAEEQGITLADVEENGPQGRIIKRDIEDYEPSGKPAAVPAWGMKRTVSTDAAPAAVCD